MQQPFDPKTALPISFSGLKQFAKSPAHFVHYKTKEWTTTAAMRRGTLVHRMLLQPEEMQNMHVVEANTRSAKAFKEAHEAHGEWACLGKELREAEDIAAAVRRHETAMKLLTAAEHKEQHLHWQCEGLDMHGFADAYGNGILLDLKVTNPDPAKFQRVVLDQAYHMQLALYSMAIDNPVKMYWVAVDPNPPHTVCVFEPSQKMAEDGVNMARLESRMFLHWIETHKPGASVLGFDHYDQGAPLTVELPSWHR